MRGENQLKTGRRGEAAIYQQHTEEKGEEAIMGNHPQRGVTFVK